MKKWLIGIMILLVLLVMIKYFNHNDYSVAQQFAKKGNYQEFYNQIKGGIDKDDDSAQDIYAKIQYEGGARIEGVALIRPMQLFGARIDDITNTQKGILFTKEKGGKEGEVLVSLDTYHELLDYFIYGNKLFKLDRQRYYNDLKQSCEISKEPQEASHGLRWNFAQRRMFEYAKVGYTYEDSLQQVSYEMKHNRASITEHYLG